MGSHFFGRAAEMAVLKESWSQKKATLLTLQGRRRIGKSTLIKHFAHKQGVLLYEFQGLAPRPGITNRDQLDHFSHTLAGYLKVKNLEFEDWSQAFGQLARLPSGKRCLILLDEISWMGAKDPDFAGKLKIAWDEVLSEQNHLMVVLCGSVSSWIQKNILDHTGFVGRLSAALLLKELSIAESMEFFRHPSAPLPYTELAKFLSVTGGVPKYLEEIAPRDSVESNLKRLCFNPAGLLFRDFEVIFSDVFGKRYPIYSSIFNELVDGPRQPVEVAHSLGLPLNGDLTEYLDDLVTGGFLARDRTWNLSGKESRLSRLRISDNYARFYLKYIAPRKSRLEKSPLRPTDSLSFLPWPAAFGYQFENLILNHLNPVLDRLELPSDDIVQLGPYFQTKTKTKPGVQIDLLIQCRKGLLYLCEIKSGSKISTEVIDEAKEKTRRLVRPKGFSVKHGLIHLGEVSDAVMESGFFDRMISFQDLVG
ncbi:ATP-binding protein [Bdellovibrionota bacterium FG-1]